MKKNFKKEKGYRIIKGNKKIIISAPHSTTHKRLNSIRPSETRTADLVRKVSNGTDIFGIYKSKPELNDANWDEKCEYKNAVTEIVHTNNIKALIDLHGMAAFREQDICIGINGGKNIKNKFYLVDDIIKIFNKYGFKNVTVDVPFAAANPNCVSTYIAKACDIIAFQIEINTKYRSRRYKEFIKYNDLEKALIDVVKLLEK